MSRVTVSSENGVFVVELNDPSTLNAASAEMVDELLDALGEAERSARAVLLTARGPGFCSGANLGGSLNPQEAGYDAGACLESHFNPLMRRIHTLRIPLITAVDGAAAGVGAALALSGDLVVASERAFFLQAFCKVGLVPDGGSATLLLHLVGRIRAMEMMLLGERVSARQALDWGMVSRVVPPDQLRDTAMTFARRLAAGPTATLGMIRRLGWRSIDTPLDVMLDLERESQRDAGGTRDHREGVAAFLDKRAAVFIGS